MLVLILQEISILLIAVTMLFVKLINFTRLRTRPLNRQDSPRGSPLVNRQDSLRSNLSGNRRLSHHDNLYLNLRLSRLLRL